MAEPVSNNERLVFGEFLAHLRQYGFTIGIDHHLRLYELLDKAGGACGPHDLKTLLCPIFATDSNQQESFYRAFDAYFNLFKFDTAATAQLDGDDVAALVASQQKPKTRARRKWLYLCGISLLALCLVGILWLRRTPSGAQEVSGGGSLGDATLPQTGPSASATPSPDSQLIPSVVQDSQEQPGFLRRHKTAIIWSSILLPLALFLLYEWHRFRRRKLTLNKQRGKKPPYVWSIRTQALTPKLYDSEQFYRAARSLRRRHVDEFYRLDVDGTISATIEALGFPSFRYKLDSKPPEYLALIERASARDHQAQLFKALTRELEREDIFVERYFYDDGDPRVCCGERGEGCLHLVDLQHKFAGYRLLVFGNGELMIDSVTGRLKSWTKIFADWPQKALLTPESPAGWSFRELSLAEQFTVLPATPDGLSRVVDHFESQAKTNLRNWRHGNSEKPPPLVADLPESIAALRCYLGEQTFQWLCACAVYPELQWDLTLFLGSLPCLGENLLRDENLLRLVRLPWFRTGSMPDDLRWALINELDREKEKAVRLALIELLENNPPPTESFAADSYQLNLVVQRWLSRRDRKRRREMLEVVKHLPPKQVEQDYTLMRFLESAASSSPALFLPSRLRKIFYHNGRAVFGLRSGARLLLTLALIALLQVSIYKFIPPITATQNLPAEIVKDKFMYPVVNGEWVWEGLDEKELAARPGIITALQEAKVTPEQPNGWRSVQFHEIHLRAVIDDNPQDNPNIDRDYTLLTCQSCHRTGISGKELDRTTPRMVCSKCHVSASYSATTGGQLSYVRPELIVIPGGTFQMGRDEPYINESPAHSVTVETFAMDRTEVTNAEYAQFVRETGHQAPSQWVDDKPLAGQEQWPVTNVSYDDALAFAAWRSKRDGVTYRLPTEEEWEFAARNGEQSTLYPWGDSWEEGRAVVDETAPKPVASFPEGKNRWGVVDLIGNAWEWTASKVSLYPGNNAVIPPDDRNFIIFRGGSYATEMSKKPVTSAYRDWIASSTKHFTLGFRLVRANQ